MAPRDVKINLRLAHGRLVQTWDELVAQIKSADKTVKVRPESAEDVIPYGTSDGTTLKFEVKPVCFALPSQKIRVVAGTGESPAIPPTLLVVVEGELQIDGDPANFNASSLQLKKFGTRVAYYSEVDGKLNHLLGLHIDDSAGGDPSHPVFHLQLKDMMTSYTKLLGEVPASRDLGDNAMRLASTRIRTPVAAHDPFACLLQLFADHLMERKGATDSTLKAFRRMLELQKILRCDNAGVRTKIVESSCIRSGHWYAA